MLSLIYEDGLKFFYKKKEYYLFDDDGRQYCSVKKHTVALLKKKYS